MPRPSRAGLDLSPGPARRGFGAIASAIRAAAWIVEPHGQVKIALGIALFEIAGAALGLLLFVRANAGSDRWSEARQLRGGIVNRSRNLALRGLAYGSIRRELTRPTSAPGHRRCADHREQF